MNTAHITPLAPASACAEDQACWDSRTMDNQQAGVGDPHGPRVVAGVVTCGSGARLEVHAGVTLCDYDPRTGAVCSTDSDCEAWERLVGRRA